MRLAAGDDGLGILCDGLRVNSSLTSLDLPDNNISDKGVALLAVAIRNNSSLTQLQLAYNRISDAGAAALAEVGRQRQSAPCPAAGPAAGVTGRLAAGSSAASP